MDGKGHCTGKVVGLLLLLGLIGGLSACGRESPPPTRWPTPTPPIRHRDAYPLMLTLDDLGAGYEVAEKHRLERGRGWGDDTTRLSGYRTIYQGRQAAFTRVLCQVECYLSVQDAQSAYRTYRERLTVELRADVRYASVSEREASALGDWGWAFEMRAGSMDAVHYLFLRENVLVEIALTGVHSPGFLDQAVRQAQVVDQQILVR